MAYGLPIKYILIDLDLRVVLEFHKEFMQIFLMQQLRDSRIPSPIGTISWEWLWPVLTGNVTITTIICF